MDTAKPLNPSKKDEAADDLIEELARLMADDAQANSAGNQASSMEKKPQAPMQAQADKPASSTGEGSTGVHGLSDSAPAQRGFDGRSGSGAGKATGEHAFDIKGFDLGTPKAEVTNLTSPPPGARGEKSAPGSPAKTGGASVDFDFGFGVGPDGSGGKGKQQPPQTAPGETFSRSAQPGSSQKPTQDPVQPGSDPIADLINAAVSKHSFPDMDTAPIPQQAEPRVDSPVSKAPVVSHSPEGNSSGMDGSGAKDRFDVPPVFGLSGKPSLAPESGADARGAGSADPAMSAGKNAMALDEIESLIGNSVQVDTRTGNPADFNAQRAVENAASVNPAAAKGPAGTNSVSSSRSELKSAAPEDAILQAMGNSSAATAKPRTFVPPTPGPTGERTGDGKDLPGMDAKTDADLQLAAGRASFEDSKSSGLLRYVVPALGVLFVGAVGFGAYTIFSPGTGEESAPVLRPDGSPTRQVPDAVETGTRSVVLNGIDGGPSLVQGEQLVSRDQSEGLDSSAIRQVDTLDTSEIGLANRRVRTVTVRPDGTIISGDDAVAGGEALNARQPDLPDLPANAINTELSSTSVAALPQNPAAGLNINLQSIATPNPTEAPTPRPRPANRDTLASVIANSAALPRSTPDALNLAGSSPSAPATPAANTAPASNSLSQPILNPGAFVQLSSQRDEAVANQTASLLQSRFSSELQGGRLLVRRVDLGARGIYYRVQLPTSTLAQANAVCDAIKEAGGECFVRNS